MDAGNSTVCLAKTVNCKMVTVAVHIANVPLYAVICPDRHEPEGYCLAHLLVGNGEVRCCDVRYSRQR